MTDPEALKRGVSVCMFDQYGTIVDMQGGLREAATPFLRAKGWAGDPNAFVTWWRRTHFENSMIDALLTASTRRTGRSGSFPSRRPWTAPASPTRRRRSAA